MRERWKGGLAAVVLLALGGCSVFQLSSPLTIGEGDWPTEGGSAARTNSTVETIEPPLEQVWRYDADAGFGPSAAVIAENTLVLVTRRGEIRGIDMEEGRKKSVGDFGEPIEGAPVLTRKMIYAPVAAGKRTIVAHDFIRGQRLWSLRAGPHSAGLLLMEETLIAAGQNGTVRAIDPADGTVRWTAVPDSTAGFFATPVALDAATIAVADDRGRVTALDLASGMTLWTETLGAPVYRTPAFDGGRLYVPTAGGRFWALDAASGEPVWSIAATNDEVLFSAPAVAGNLVVVGASDGVLRAIEASNGTGRWTFTNDGNFAAAPLLAGDVVYAGTLDEKLMAFDADSGDVLWEHTLGGRIKSAPVLHDGRLIVLAEPKHAYAFEAVSPVAASSSD